MGSKAAGGELAWFILQATSIFAMPNIIKMCERPFADLAEMHEALIKSLNGTGIIAFS